MSMCSSMCKSMTGRPTRAQVYNEQKRQSYGYYQNSLHVKSKPVEGKLNAPDKNKVQ